MIRFIGGAGGGGGGGGITMCLRRDRTVLEADWFFTGRPSGSACLNYDFRSCL